MDKTDKKEEKGKEGPVEWGTGDEKLVETISAGYDSEKAKDSKRKR